jgi:hypothetical protein
MLRDKVPLRRGNVVAVPMLNLEICKDFRAYVINRNVSMLAELFLPILKRLLVDVVFAALAGHCGKET